MKFASIVTCLVIFVTVSMTTVGGKNVVEIPALEDLPVSYLEALLISKSLNWTREVKVVRDEVVANAQTLETEKKGVETDMNTAIQIMEFITRQYDDWLKSLRQRVNYITKKLTLDGQIRVAAFQAFLSDPKGDFVTLTAYNPDYPITFRVTTINLSEAYNPATGLMTAPAHGIYFLAIRIKVLQGRGNASFSILQNGNVIATAEATRSSAGDDQAVAIALALLSPGDIVEVRSNLGTTALISCGSQTWFMGFLLNHRTQRIYRQLRSLIF